MERTLNTVSLKIWNAWTDVDSVFTLLMIHDNTTVCRQFESQSVNRMEGVCIQLVLFMAAKIPVSCLSRPGSCYILLFWPIRLGSPIVEELRHANCLNFIPYCCHKRKWFSAFQQVASEDLPPLSRKLSPETYIPSFSKCQKWLLSTSHSHLFRMRWQVQLTSHGEQLNLNLSCFKLISWVRWVMGYM